MITMLFEKTLSRKVVSVSSKAIVEVTIESNANGNGNGRGHGHIKHSDPSRLQRIRALLAKVCGHRKAKKVEKKDFASMGKILNLMR
jgi:hypothetical protein